MEKFTKTKKKILVIKNAFPRLDSVRGSLMRGE